MVKEIAAISGENVAKCYQCGKCTAACPVNMAMDILPHQVLRFLQLGLVEAVLNCNTIWICASCFTCAGRCPRGVDLPGVMEALRAILLRKRGFSRFKAGDMPRVLNKGMPEQGIVSGFRKYTK
ncbi:MAG: heterodisulfide reductase [Dethiobacter sp.]|jgi:heterodisulfide reductase subunit C|nr:MAG: heterodisulfide reductase [Dethiobacter sp.]